MNAQSYVALYGRDKAKKVAEAAGTNYRYFHHIVKGKRRPSVELAKKLVVASGGELGLMDLLEAVNWDEKRAEKA